MLTQYHFTMVPDRPCQARAEWGYHLYAALLERLPEHFGTQVHQDGASPISQFLSQKDGRLYWTVSLLGEQPETLVSPILEKETAYFLRNDAVRLSVSAVRRVRIADVDELFFRGAACGGIHRLEFCTPAAFKSRGHYLNLPTPRLILQSLIKKWNGCLPECPIEDDAGEGLEAMADGLACRDFQLWDQGYRLKRQYIPGFRGRLTLENKLSGFHKELADALLLFSHFSGIGIKTTLGMGGVHPLPPQAD